jgi:hypothetical protein
MPNQQTLRVYSHSLLHLPPAAGPRWRIGHR